MIKKFSDTTKRELKYYVYRLVDPRNGNTFYVGKGKGDRVFTHMNNMQDLDSESNEFLSLKEETIKEILAVGLDVIPIIHRWGLDNETALIVEAALIQAYSLDTLTNIQNGYGVDDYGMNNAETLEKILNVSEYEEDENTWPYIIIKIREETYLKSQSYYEACRSAWKINKAKANRYPYVLCVIQGIVKEVYKCHEWVSLDNGRCEFYGEVADQKIRDHFLNHKIPAKYREKGCANPIRYSESYE